MDRINELVQKHIKNFNGSILVKKEKEIIHFENYGYADIEHEIPVSKKTKFRIGSLTKQFTAASILLLLSDGKLNLDDTLDRFIPDYINGERITIDHLLTHRSGIYNYTAIDNYLEFASKAYTTIELINTFRNKQLEFEPGTKYKYSNSGYVILGYIIELLSNMTYEEFVCKRIFNEVGMVDSGYDSHLKIIKNRARGYERDDETYVTYNADFVDMSIPHAAGGLYSTIYDLVKWYDSLYSFKVIKEKYLDLMIKPHASTGNEFYGYGQYITLNESDQVVKIAHDGGIDGFYSTSRFYPRSKIQLIVLSNEIVDEFFDLCEEIEKLINDSQQ